MAQAPDPDPTPGPPAPGGTTTDPGPVGGLPAPVRARIVDWAAAVLGVLPRNQVPAEVQRIASFAPAKRAKLGAAALATAIDRHNGFRALASGHGHQLGGDSAVDRAARAFLDRTEELDAALGELAEGERSSRDSALEAEVTALRARIAELERSTGTPSPAMTLDAGLAAEADKLRKRLREQGTRARADRDRVAELARQLEQARADGAAALSAERAKTREWAEKARIATERADRAEHALGRQRETVRSERAQEDRRLDLLLSALEGAATGLRREWDLVGGGSDPADIVAARWQHAGPPAESTHDGARLLSWLQVPQAHLIIDGYNVTKSARPELTLVQQREDLVRAVAALSSRTGAEVTVVFDGAAVTVPAPVGRGVRVLFSPPGVIADDVVRDLAAAEPRGRFVIVVSSDREVVAGARAVGARTAPSSVLAGLLWPAATGIARPGPPRAPKK